jgi:hypothetical protein
MKNDNSISPFRFAKYIQNNIPLSTDELKDFSPYLICRLYYYSGEDKICNLLNVLWRLPKELQYRLYCIFFAGFYPRGWIKSNKQKEPDKLEVEYLKKKYCVSSKVAREYAVFLSVDEKKEIKKRFE